MFSLIHVGERSGTGICDVYHVWDENGFKKPSFVETVDPYRVTLTLQIETDGNPDGNDGNLDGKRERADPQGRSHARQMDHLKKVEVSPLYLN